MANIVAYLDVLGFKAYTKDDFDGAVRLLGHQELILRQKIQDGQLHPPSVYADSSLAALAKAHLVDSFKYFLPFSDSLFILSDSPDDFARQLSNFLFECLFSMGHIYDDPIDPARPEIVEVIQFPSGTKRQQSWYPPLWRGGLATGGVVAGGVSGIENGEHVRIPNLAGPAVVDAVLMQDKCRGPRLLCEPGLVAIFGPEVRPFFHKITDAVSELLWPAFAFNLNNDPQNEMSEFFKLWYPALGLWKSKRGHPAFEHYDEFLKLLIRAFLCWADLAGCAPEARKNARQWIADGLSEDLIEMYLIPSFPAKK